MKKSILILISFLFFTNFLLSQEKIYYLKLDDNFKIIKSKDNKSVILSFLHVKDGLDFNVYYFNIENEKIDEYNEKGVKLDYKNVVLLDESFYSNLSPCELHDFFSSNRNLYLVKESDNKFFGWYLFYQYTSKNTIITVQTTRI